MILIATVDENWALSFQKSPLVQIPADQRFFRKETQGKTVIMGYRTLLSLPAGQPVLGRENIVLAPAGIKLPGSILHATSVSEVLSLVQGKKADEIYVTGGAGIYEAFLPYCHMAHITMVEYSYRADCYLTNLEEEPGWRRTGESDEQTYYDLTYHFIKYEKNS